MYSSGNRFSRKKFQNSIFKILLTFITFSMIIFLIRAEGFFFGIHF